MRANITGEFVRDGAEADPLDVASATTLSSRSALTKSMHDANSRGNWDCTKPKSPVTRAVMSTGCCRRRMRRGPTRLPALQGTHRLTKMNRCFDLGKSVMGPPVLQYRRDVVGRWRKQQFSHLFG